ncbi:MAG: Flp pilus assembly complex ATPase component TadA, partial [Planctomycetaceae bacterium]|nr:Flp pilus assembly complex ATPase component TadA [Planctomycetaceae bacterium]
MAGDWLQQFVDDGTISADQLREAEGMASKLGISVESALVRLEYVDETRLAEAKSREYGYEFVDLDEMEISQSMVELVPESVARENIVIPIGEQGGRLKVAVEDPMNFDVLQKLQFILNRDIEMVMASKESILTAINRSYGQSETESVDSMLLEFTETAIDFTETDLAEATAAASDEESSPIVRLVNLIISEAVSMRASDIHIEPFEDRVRIRYRIDGVLIERDAPPRRLLGALTSRLKVMGNIDIAEKRRPQDGRIKTRAGSKDFDLRVSVLPTN